MTCHPGAEPERGRRIKFKREHFCCSPKLLREIEEIREVEAAIGEVVWTDHFTVEVNGRTYEHQSGYNRALAAGLHKFGWTMQPKLCTVPRLIGDASKNDVFVEVEFGNSATCIGTITSFTTA